MKYIFFYIKSNLIEIFGRFVHKSIWRKLEAKIAKVPNNVRLERDRFLRHEPSK